MKVLITGANGQIGWELQKSKPENWIVLAFNHTEFDITDSTAIDLVFKEHQPDLVINTAAFTAVDKAESEQDKAYEVNVVGAANIARASKAFQAHLIHLSTDFVFDGTKSQPYLPGDKTNPISTYGKSKLQGEEAVITETANKALILRSAWLYSSHGSNFVKTMLRLMKEKNEISVVADQIGTPTWGRDLAKAIYNFADVPRAQGIYHWTDAGVASWYDFAIAIQEEAHQLGLLQKNISIKPIRTQDFPTPAKRPAFSVLDKTATWKTLGYTALHWRKSLRSMLQELREL